MSEPGADNKTTDFGYQQVPVAEKEQRVGAVFRSVAPRYDLMNDLMSLGTHRLIKRFTVELSALRADQCVLDLAGGTGDLGIRFARIVGASGQVVVADVNQAMLSIARDRVIDQGLGNNVDFVRADAEGLPFADASFDCVCIAFGLRNLTDKQAALVSMRRVLKPGGRLLILEFSRPVNPVVSKAYAAWSALWPMAGRLVAGDAASYRYLVESIRMHPDQETLLAAMATAGLTDCRYHNLMNGICAVHLGFKPA